MFWKYYFRLMAALFVVANVATFLGARAFAIKGSLDALDRALTVMSLVGLFGYAWKQQVLSRQFWKVFVPFYVAWGFAYVFLLETPPTITRTNIPEALLVMPFVFPLYFALFRYAYGRSVTASS